MKRRYIQPATLSIFLLAILPYLQVGLFAQSAKKYPQNYFRWPLNIRPEIVANLGELRSNHWHMGLDIRTQQRQNLRVYAAAAGYVSKIRIEKFGFGRCIYITHPNGYTTLYAHLNNFFPALEEYVEKEQYRQETWAIELDFPKDKFPVTKGQFIAFSGTTGGSLGPHVHFEIRDSKTGTCLNPLLFNMPLPDKVRPSILKLAMYDRNRSIYEQTPQYFPLKYVNGNFVMPGNALLRSGSDKVSFAIQAIDKISGSSNEDGIFSAKLYFDDKPVIGFSFDSISYEKTRYLNAHIDYKYRFNGGPYFQHVAELPGDQSGVYYPVSGDGTIHLTDTEVHSVRIEVSDAYQNKSQLQFSLRYDKNKDKPDGLPPDAPRFIPNYTNLLERPGFEMYLPENSLYDTLTSFYNRDNSFPAGAVTASHQVNDPSVPLHGQVTVRMKPDRAIGAGRKDKVVIQRTYRNSTDLRKVQWEGDWMTAKFNEFGSFQAFVDDVPPTINDLGRGDTINLSGVSRITFQPKDNFEVIRSFRAELDGKWLRFTNDKGRSFIYIFDEHCPYGVHELKVRVEDLAGNSTVKTWWFKRYRYTAPPKRKTTTSKRKK